MTISQAVAANAPLRGCVFQLAPLVTIDQQGKVSGPVIDYFRRHIEPVIGRTIEWQGLNVARLLSNLESGECDLTPLRSYSPERARHFRYIDPHLLLLVLGSSRLHSVERQEDLYGTTIGWSSQAIVPPLLQHPQIHIDTLSQLSWEHGNMQKLLRGRIDAALSPRCRCISC
ncbi:MAG: substrate-binding periplasmic protein [Aeromonas sobria]